MSKIFVSYKYADSNVRRLNGRYLTTVRNYVDLLQETIGEDHINKGEDDGEDMSTLADSTIQSKLGDKIYDSSITIVMISPNMKDNTLAEKDQWIPWEISYSLREQSRNNRTSKTNAMLAVVLPDSCGNYEYFIQEHSCQYCNSNSVSIYKLFDILRVNMFNRKEPQYSTCQYHSINQPETGFESYIHIVKWDDFINNHQFYIDTALYIKENIESYKITKNLQ